MSTEPLARTTAGLVISTPYAAEAFALPATLRARQQADDLSTKVEVGLKDLPHSHQFSGVTPSLSS